MAFMHLAALLATAACASPIIELPLESKHGDFKLMLLAPGGKVPPENYLPMAKAAQEKSNLRMAVGIPRCHINLCDAIFELPGLLKEIVASVNETAGGALKTTDVFITGHSLGGTGARYFYDVWPGSAGLALFGTQYNGDHEDFKGTLGYPVDLKAFPGPLLALTGELDMLPISHTAELVRQWQALGEGDFYFQKLPIIVPGMDHSQFCPPFQVSGDILPVIPNAEATSIIGDILASWLDAVVSEGVDTSAVQVLRGYADQTAPIAAPFIKATEYDKTWCASVQQLMVKTTKAISVVSEHRYDSANLEHCHPSASMDGTTLKVTVCDYLFYTYTNRTIPDYAPTYQGPQDISCKMVSEDKIAKELGLEEVDMNSKEVINRCSALNQEAFNRAMSVVTANWPAAASRFHAQGKEVNFKDDSQAFMGPQWVLTGLGFSETEKALDVQSEALVSPLSSRFYPGSHYCKLLAPSKAVEFIMTRGLTLRYSGASELQSSESITVQI